MASQAESARNKRPDEISHMIKSIETPPPPGFASGGFSDSTARFYGENLSRAAAASAPPTSFQFSDLSSEFLRSHDLSQRELGGKDSNSAGFIGNGSIQIDNIDSAKETLRTMSYNNLAMALGEDLAEYIGESTDEINLNDSRHSFVGELR
jgi:hypothetical protein